MFIKAHGNGYLNSDQIRNMYIHRSDDGHHSLVAVLIDGEETWISSSDDFEQLKSYQDHIVNEINSHYVTISGTVETISN